jgi:hypothetical protein
MASTHESLRTPELSRALLVLPEVYLILCRDSEAFTQVAGISSMFELAEEA